MEALTIELRERPRRWLVTGAAGFIGSHLVQRLLGMDQEVVGLDNFITGKRENLSDVHAWVGDSRWERFRLVEGDIRDRSACEAAVEGVEHVLHQAAMGSVPRSMKDPRTSHEINVDGFLNMLEASRAAGCSGFVYASSSSVYGDDPGLPKVESRTGRPLSPYAATKRANETYATAWATAYGLRTVGLRYFNVVGPRQDPEGPYAAVVPRWVRSLVDGGQPVIFGDGKTSRDFCPVENVTQLNLLAATGDSELAGTVFNVALGSRTTLDELYATIRSETARHDPRCGSVEPRYEDFRPGDIRHSQAEIARAVDLLGYVPEQSLAESLRATVDWFSRDVGKAEASV